MDTSLWTEWTRVAGDVFEPVHDVHRVPVH